MHKNNRIAGAFDWIGVGAMGKAPPEAIARSAPGVGNHAERCAVGGDSLENNIYKQYKISAETLAVFTGLLTAKN
ncbi:hypothetical protein [Nodularia chucula]|uniref:hypothetical protein n=1 Tax=Nodularia chucula TaxID=3093667 RepID=UPI0039C65243